MATAAHQIQPDGNLPQARQRLHDAIATLIDPHTELAGSPTCPDCHNEACEHDCTQHTCPGHQTEVPSLYERLYDAMPGAQGTGHSPARSMPPMWLDAARLYAWIDTTTRKWQADYQHCQHCKHCTNTLPAIQRLQTMRAKRWRPQDTRQLEDYATQIEAWALEIDLLLTPQHVKHVTAACPSCGHKTALRRDNAGETVRVPALQIIAETGCTCVVCHAHWAPTHYMLLCKVLGFPVPEGVLE